ncbi:MAG: hypothetical protein BGO82_07820 [Devosia sp. 67-54]|uniref:hypothetical protein n=1 Tax=unclassified Devosia TaxID=196773 RepID=UPI0009687722|nr:MULTISPECIES: hypothetical protein [unclassified Devosia]MBN9307225.1 hypothetical protein [Devosia sp.]OJX19618.1 MAG: hypothetical protein BGO82_07820 [Devosia sp. 67-54]
MNPARPRTTPPPGHLEQEYQNGIRKPEIDAYLFDHGFIDDRLDIIETLAERGGADAQTRLMQNDALVAAKQRAEAAEAAFVQRALTSGLPVVNDLAAAGPETEAEGGSLLGGERRPYVLESDYKKLQRATAKARKTLTDFQQKAQPAPGTKSWADVAGEATTLVSKLAMENVDIEPFQFAGKPSRKSMADAAKVAEAAHARRKAVTEAVVDRATAEAMLRGAIRAETPLHVSIQNCHVAGALRLPLVDLKWGPGRSEPAPEDVAAMFLSLLGERIEDDLFEQLDRRYTDCEQRGVLTLSAAERRRELGIAQAAIDAAEAEEAAHLIGIIEQDDVLIRPPARMSAKALLGIAP